MPGASFEDFAGRKKRVMRIETIGGKVEDRASRGENLTFTGDLCLRGRRGVEKRKERWGGYWRCTPSIKIRTKPYTCTETATGAEHGAFVWRKQEHPESPSEKLRHRKVGACQICHARGIREWSAQKLSQKKRRCATCSNTRKDASFGTDWPKKGEVKLVLAGKKKPVRGNSVVEKLFLKRRTGDRSRE